MMIMNFRGRQTIRKKNEIIETNYNIALHYIKLNKSGHSYNGLDWIELNGISQ